MSKRTLIFWMTILILVVIGIGLAFAASSIQDQGSFWKLILNRLSTAALTTSLLGFLNRILLEENLLSLILTKVNLKRDLNDSGLERVFTSISDIDYKDLFSTSKQIDIVHVYGRTWTSNNEDSIVEALKRGAKVNVMLCDEKCPSVSGLAMMYDMTKDKVESRILGVLDEWQSILKKVSKNRHKNFTIRKSQMMPSYSLYKFDDNMVVITNRLSKGERTKKVNSYQCTNVNGKTTLFSNHERDLQNLITNSEVIHLTSK